MRRRGPAILLLIILIGVAAVAAILLLTRGNNQTPPATDGTNANTQAINTGSVTSGVVVPSAPTATPVPASVRVIAVARNLNQGAVLAVDDVSYIEITRAEYDADPNRDTYFTEPGAVVGRILKNPLTARQVIRRTDIVDGNFSSYMKQLVSEKRLEPGKKAFAYATNDLSAAGGLIAEGDLVDVIATYIFERKDDLTGQTADQVVTAASGNGSTIVRGATTRSTVLELSTKTVLQNIRVLRVIRFGPPIAPFREQVPTPTVNPGNLDVGGTTPTVVAAGPGTPTPVPTIPPYEESGRQFATTQILVLAVTDQEAEILKFTREARVALSASILSVAQSQPNVLTSASADRNILATIPVVHFTLRSRPQDAANPQDPAITIDKTSGVTYRTLVRDYGLPIPEVVFATNLNR